MKTFLIFLFSAVAAAQTINPNQIRPSNQNGYVLTTPVANQPPSWQPAPGTNLSIGATSPITVNGGSGPVLSGLATIACPGCGANFSYAVTPPIGGAYQIVYPTGVTLVSSYEPPDAADTTSAALYSPVCASGCTIYNATATYTFALPSNITPGNVTAVYGDAWWSTDNVSLAAGGTDFEIQCGVSPSFQQVAHYSSSTGSNQPLNETTGHITSATGANFNSMTCEVSNTVSGSVAIESMNSFMNTLRVLVYDSVDTLTTPEGPYVAAPIDWNPVLDTLGFDPNYLIAGTGITVTKTGAARTIAATGSVNVAGGVLGSVPYQTAPGATGVTAANTTAGTLCLTETGTGTVGAAPVWGACSGSAATAWSAITAGTNAGQALLVGAGSSLGRTAGGTIDSSAVGGITVTGTPSAGQVLTATSSSAANWQAGSGGVSSLTGDGALITNSGSTGAVTLTLGYTPAHSGANSDITSLTALSTPLSVPQGGSGAATLTGHISGHGTSAMTASATIPGADISGNISGTASNLSGTPALPNGTTATTQATSDSSTKLATTAFVKNPGAISPSSITLSGAGPSTMGLPPVTYATLQGAFPCASNQGRIGSISDSTTTTWGAVISGGGSNFVLAVCNGSAWTVIGK